MEKDRQLDLALWRFGIISPLLHREANDIWLRRDAFPNDPKKLCPYPTVKSLSSRRKPSENGFIVSIRAACLPWRTKS